MDSLTPFLNFLFLVVGTIFGFFLKSFLPDYFGQKGKNLATKEDIEEITERTERARQRQQRGEEKLDKVNEYLNHFAELAELYAFLARTEEHLVKNDSGEFVKDEAGNYIIEKHILEPEPRFEEAIETLTGSDFRGAIAQKIIEIRTKSGEVIDIADEIDSRGELSKKFAELYWQTVQSVEFWIKHKDYEQMVSSLREAKQTRRKIYSILQTYRNNT